MTMHAEHEQDHHEAPGEPKIIVEEGLETPGGPRASKAQILILKQEATDPKEVMICTAALESPNESVREVALAACAELWERRRARLRARRDQELQLPQLPKLEKDTEADDDPSEEELAVGDLTGVLEILGSTPIGPRKASGTRPGNRVATARLVEFPCPLCHRPILGEEDHGILRVPRHHITVPVFPHGFAMPAHLIRCPASGSPITECCSREHGGSACGDPQCWRLPAEQPRPFSEDTATAGSRVVASRAPRGYPDRPPGCTPAGGESAEGIEGVDEFGDGGEIDGTVVDGEPIPTDGWQIEPTMMAAEAFRGEASVANDEDDPAGDIDLAMTRFARSLR